MSIAKVIAETELNNFRFAVGWEFSSIFRKVRYANCPIRLEV
jgi:hypothetical protein